MPGTPTVMLDPELALALFVAPVLLDAAFDASPRDLREHWRPVASLALVAVGLTVAALAATVRWLVPGLPWAAAIALGASPRRLGRHRRAQPRELYYCCRLPCSKLVAYSRIFS